MDNFSASQYDRFEAYRRHALPKTAVRKVSLTCAALLEVDFTHICAPQVIQQTLGQQVSQPVAQIVAGFGKVFVGEIVEKGGSLPTSSSYAFINFHMFPSPICTRAERRARSTYTRPSSGSIQTVPSRDRASRCGKTSTLQTAVCQVGWVCVVHIAFWER